jgi:hypothetical protein
MKTICLIFGSTLLIQISSLAQQSCLEPDKLTMLDARWEKALLESDVDKLKSIMAEDFIWVHNHASLTDSKTSVLKRAEDPNVGATGKTKSRVSKDVKAIILGSTGIVTGITIVDRGPTPATYHFMRTYVEMKGGCFLLANQTMAIPENDK